MGDVLESSLFWGRARAASWCLGFALVLAGCQEIDLGEHTKPGEIAYEDDLYAISGIGDDHLWAAGYFGAIYYTADGGETWRKQDSLTEGSIYDISFADAQNGWAVGRRGFIIHTRDGGQTWERQKSPRHPPRHLFAVHAIDASTAWTIGDWGSRYVTHDGGKTWLDESFLVDEEHPVFQYLSEEELEAFERGEKVYDDTYLNDVHFLSAQVGWIVGEYGQIFRTTDGGQTWEKGEIQGTLAFDPVPFDALVGDVARERWDYLFGVAEKLIEKPYLRVRVEGYLTAAELAKVGNTTLADDRAQAVADFLEGEGVSQDRIRMVNPTPFDESSVDMEEFRNSKLAESGRADIRILETPFLFDVKFRDSMNGLIAGLGGVILRSEDGGATWIYQDSNAEIGIYSVAQGGQAAWAVGEKGLHRRSEDGGLTWARLAPDDEFQKRFEFFGYMRDIIFPTDQRGWIVGRAGFVLRSSDGGGSWERIHLMPRDAEPASAVGE
jgi:photosystem II stability/assembly factor-like uncharacterized protein